LALFADIAFVCGGKKRGFCRLRWMPRFTALFADISFACGCQRRGSGRLRSMPEVPAVHFADMGFDGLRWKPRILAELFADLRGERRLRRL
jgi:hypothetical protein